MRPRPLAATLAAGLVFGACNSGEAVPKFSKNTRETMEALEEIVKMGEFARAGKNAFSDAVHHKRQASFLLGTCIGSESINLPNAVVVTMSPGYITHKEGKRSLSMIMGEYVKHSKGATPRVFFSGDLYKYTRPNGKVVDQIKHAIRYESHDQSAAGPQIRRVSAAPSVGELGIASYTDSQTGTPLAATVVVDGPYNADTVSSGCDMLVPGYSNTADLVPIPQKPRLVQA